MKRLIENLPAIRRSRELARHDRWTSEQLQAHQQQRLIEIVDHARTRSAFYRRLYQDIDEFDLERLPVIDKATVMDHFDELVCDPRLMSDFVGLRPRLPVASRSPQSGQRVRPT